MNKKLSVIIPVHNEEQHLAETIQKVKRRGGKNIGEVIVADACSTDRTAEVARLEGARLEQTPQKGRAAQMNAGAAHAQCDILYFLHADTIPPINFAQSIMETIDEGYKAGCFQLGFDGDHPMLSFYAWFTQFDINAFRFGDQSLFIDREAFVKLGGFRSDHQVMEDNEIVRRIERHYSFAVLGDAVRTSSRAYLEDGVLKLQLIFVLIYVLYFLGVEQSTLIKIKKSYKS